MKKTLIALVALSGMAMAAEDSFSTLDLDYVAGNDYTLTLTLNTTDYAGASKHILKTADGVNLFCQIGQYVGVEKDGNDTLSSVGGVDHYNESPITVTAGESEFWFINLGGNRLNSLTLCFEATIETDTTKISITKPSGDGAFTTPIVLNVDKAIDPTQIQLNVGRVSSYDVSFVSTPEPATATLSLLALAGLAARRRRH